MLSSMTDTHTNKGTSVLITLLPYEYVTAANVGARRVSTAIFRNSENQHGFKKGHGWEEHIEGACAEMAVAKHFDIYWDGSNGTYKLPDLSGSMQVRWTPYENGKLIVRPADDEYCKYVLVTGRCPNYTIRGYIQGASAKNESFLDNLGDSSRPAVYAIPQSSLLDIKEIC